MRGSSANVSWAGSAYERDAVLPRMGHHVSDHRASSPRNQPVSRARRRTRRSTDSRSYVSDAPGVRRMHHRVVATLRTTAFGRPYPPAGKRVSLHDAPEPAKPSSRTADAGGRLGQNAVWRMPVGRLEPKTPSSRTAYADESLGPKRRPRGRRMNAVAYAEHRSNRGLFADGGCQSLSPSSVFLSSGKV